MKIIDAEKCEWGNELVRVLPFVYNQHLAGMDVEVHTTKGMKPFYFFLDEDRVKEKYKNRYGMTEINTLLVPQQNLYDDELDYSFWTPPPFKKEFEKKEILFPETILKNRKPILIISNKYNNEWRWKGINTIPLKLLDGMFSKLKAHFNIIYNRINPKYLVNDGDVLPYGDFSDTDILDKHSPDVIDVNDLYEMQMDMDISEFQLRLFAKANHFVNVQGGIGHFASFFGGRQLFFIERNGHIHIPHHRLNKIQAWHSKTGGAEIDVMNKENWQEKITFLSA